MPSINISDRETQQFIKRYLEEEAGIPQLMRIGKLVVDNMAMMQGRVGGNDIEEFLRYVQKKLGSPAPKARKPIPLVPSEDEDWN